MCSAQYFPVYPVGPRTTISNSLLDCIVSTRVINAPVFHFGKLVKIGVNKRQLIVLPEQDL